METLRQVYRHCCGTPICAVLRACKACTANTSEMRTTAAAVETKYKSILTEAVRLRDKRNQHTRRNLAYDRGAITTQPAYLFTEVWNIWLLTREKVSVRPVGVRQALLSLSSPLHGHAAPRPFSASLAYGGTMCLGSGRCRGQPHSLCPDLTHGHCAAPSPWRPHSLRPPGSPV